MRKKKNELATTKVLIELKKKIVRCKCGVTEENFRYIEHSNTSYYVRPSHINNLYLNEKEFKKYEPFLRKVMVVNCV